MKNILQAIKSCLNGLRVYVDKTTKKLATQEDTAEIKGLAETAQATADSAQIAANNAQIAANNAQTTADNAQTAANNAQTIAELAIKNPEEASVGQTIVVKSVDENGKPTEWEAVDLPGGGLSYTEKNLILSLFKNAAYTTNMSATIARLETLWSETPETPENGVEQIGKVLSIVSGVTVNQIGSILTIA